MKEIVISCRYGGFGLSHKAIIRYAELKGITLYPWFDDITREIYGERATVDNDEILIHYTTVPEKKYKKMREGKRKDKAYFSGRDFDREDPILIQVIRELKRKADGRFARLKIVKIPDDVEYHISEYDGTEHIAENHRTWA